jgi:hypothetical protein
VVSWEELQRRDQARRGEMLRLGTVKLERVGRLEPPDIGLQLVSSSVNWDGRIIALWVPDAEMAAFEPDLENYPGSRTRTNWGAVVTVHGSQTQVVARIRGLSLAHPFVQLLPQGRVLVVGARCEWNPAGAERNALVYDGQGRLVIQATLGDGIAHVRTTSAGNVWVGYFDEGIFGNYGWGGVDARAPVGVSGIVCFTSELERAWEYSRGRNSSVSPIHDCYALNVDGESVWAYYYSDFPVVRIEDGAVRAWTTEVAGARALAVRSDNVSLAGGYGSERDRLVTGALQGGKLVVRTTQRIVLPDGSEVPERAVVTGHGSQLHVIHGQDWFTLGM